MADIHSVIPASTTTPVTSPGAGNAMPQTSLSGALVQQAPATLTTPAQLTGTVISSNPQTQQLNIQTPQGPIVVQSAISLPPNTPVSIALFASNGQMRATVTVMQQNVAQTQTQTLEEIIQPDLQTAAPPPALQEGSTVTALQLQGQPPAQPVQIGQLAASIETLKETGIQNVQLPLPPEQLQALLTTPDVENFLKQLSPQLLQNLANAFAGDSVVQKQGNPGILRQLLSVYLPQNPDTGASTPAVSENALPDVLDNNLLQIMRAQLQIKATQQNIQSPPAPGNTKQAAFSPLTTTLDALFSSSEEASQKTSGFSSMLRQLMPQNIQESTPQNMFQLHILKILPPGTTPEKMKSILLKMPAAAQAGEVETTTSGGQPILKTALQTAGEQFADEHFVVTTPVNVPVGSKIIFEAAPMTPEEILQTVFSAAPDDSDLLQKGSWTALQQTLQALPSSGAGPLAAAAQALRNTLPTPTPQLAPTALFFLAALRSGSISNWLGANTLQALQQAGQKELAASLSNDFDKLAAQSKDVLPTGNWRSISIPLRYDEQISQMQFYVRQQHDQSGQQKEQGSGKPATRFILNLNLSRMGAVQLDGFIQKKNFDIILRTEERLPFDMRQELMKHFAQGLDQVQMQGGISFQTRQQSWMVPEAGNVTAEA